MPSIIAPIARRLTPLAGTPASRRLTPLAAAFAALAAAVPGQAVAAQAAATGHGQLEVSTSRYTGANIQPGVTVLPPGCTSDCATATTDGAYPYVFNNALVDPSFGVTSPITLERITPTGQLVSRREVPTGDLVTSFSSKSELALNQSTSGRQITFMGYVAPNRAVDVSNANTPGVIDPSNPVPGAYYRAVGALSSAGQLSFTETNAYSGDNGRAAIANDSGGQSLLYAAGNAGNGSTPQPVGVILGAGAQLLDQTTAPEADQTPGQPTPVASFNVTQLGDPADKIGKDDNFRGETIFNNVLYYTKGSGGNGVNTVYFVDTSGSACPNGVGVPQPGATLPTTPLAYNPQTLQADGLPSNMCILRGFPDTPNKDTSTPAFPFGIFFANPDTLYVADEGDGVNTFANGVYTDAAAQTTAGLQKWVLDPSTQSWHLAYTLQAGLNLGHPYTVPGYPTGDNSATGLPWPPATDGLRNLAGRVSRNGTVTLWAVTSTVSGSGDQGADPNELVSITDRASSSAPATGEHFVPVVRPSNGQVVRGVSLATGESSGATP